MTDPTPAPPPAPVRQATIVLGFGSGAPALDLLSKAGTGDLLVIIEKDDGKMRRLRPETRFAGLFGDRRVLWVVAADRQGIYRALRSRGPELLGMKVRFLAAKSAVAADREYYIAAKAAVEDFAHGAKTALGAQWGLIKPITENLLRLLPWYAGLPSVADLRPAYAGRSAIAVGGGPSLREDLPGLAALSDAPRRPVIISCDVVLKPLLAAGVPVDFCTVVDWQPNLVAKFFEGLRAEAETVRQREAAGA